MGRENLIDRAKEVPSEIRSEVKTILLGRKIHKEIGEGRSTDDIVSQSIPTLDIQTIENDIAQLEAGIRQVYDSMGQNMDNNSIRQCINKQLSKLDTDLRVRYQINLIKAVIAAYPDVILDKEKADMLEQIDSAEEKTDDDVECLMGIIKTILPKVGALLQRSTCKCMDKFLHKLEPAKVEELLNSGKDAALAYAAACYIAQKNGELNKVNGELASGMPAYSLGIAAATSIESSRLVAMYNAGKIHIEVLVEKLRNLYTIAITYISENAISILAGIAQGITIAGGTLILMDLFYTLGAAAIASPVVIFACSYLLAAGVIPVLFTLEDFEDAIQCVWDLMKNIWGFIKNAFYSLTGRSEQMEGESENEEDTVLESEEDDEEEEDEDFVFEGSRA